MHTAFEGKVALVPGAPRGIGLATAKAFAMAGASVVVADHNEKLLNEAAEKLRGEGHNVLAVTCDVSDKAQVAAMVGLPSRLMPVRCCFQQRRYQLQRNAHG
jgi:NAD(P)-dependent dehydrogenase (short-subunit alcohol dehydrogenase family)